MNLKKNTDNTRSKAYKKGAVVNDSVGNYEKHPFFVKKANAARELLLKVGLPKELAKRKHA